MKTTSSAGSPHTKDTEPSDDMELTEERMRRALGLGGPSASRTLTLRPNSSAPGGRSITVGESSNRRVNRAKDTNGQADALSPLHGRVAELEQQIATEWQQHEATRRQVQQAEAAVRAIETRLQEEAARQKDELEAVRQAGITAQRARDDALFSIQERRQIKPPPARAPGATNAAPTTSDESPAKAKPRLSGAKAQAANVAPKKRGQPRIHPLPEPKPVRWWTPSYRAKGRQKG